MKNKKGLLVCTLGLMLSVGVLTGCGNGNNNSNNGNNPTSVENNSNNQTESTHTVTFYRGNEELHSETVEHGAKCPEYTPAEREGYTFQGWYETRSHNGEKFDFNTPIESDYELYAWYKENFKKTEDKYYVVGSMFNGGSGAWDGTAAYESWKDRDMTYVDAELVNERNVFTFSFDAPVGDKWRCIKASKDADGQYVSNGWTDDYGYTIIRNIVGPEGEALDKDTHFQQGEGGGETGNIIMLIGGNLTITLDVTDPLGCTLDIKYNSFIEAEKTQYVSAIGTFNDWAEWQEGATDNSEIEFTKQGETNVWSADITFEANAQFKIRVNHKWGFSYGYYDLDLYPQDAITGSKNPETDEYDGNILVLVAGTYQVDFFDDTHKINIVLKTTDSGDSGEDGGQVTPAVNPLKAVYDAAVGETVEFDAVYLKSDGSYHFFANGDMGITVYKYGLTLPAGTMTCDPLHVKGKVSVYNGLIQVDPTEITECENYVEWNSNMVYNGEALTKYDLSKQVSVTGIVKTAYTYTAGQNGSAYITVGSGDNAVDFQVYIKKNANLAYEDLQSSLTVGSLVTLVGYISIYDSAATVNYATSTGYQLTFPTVVVM